MFQGKRTFPGLLDLLCFTLLLVFNLLLKIYILVNFYASLYCDIYVSNRTCIINISFYFQKSAHSNRNDVALKGLSVSRGVWEVANAVIDCLTNRQMYLQ